MNALLFPGQGSQVVGMGSEFYSNFDIVKKIFKQADEKLNYPISKLILEGPENKLQLTENTQPAILTVSYAIFKVLKDEFGRMKDEPKRTSFILHPSSFILHVLLSLPHLRSRSVDRLQRPHECWLLQCGDRSGG